MKSRDLSVYDFKEEDELTETCNQWSKLTNPKFDDIDVPISKYHFLQHAASGSVAKMKEIHTVEQIHVVAIDDDDHGFVDDIPGCPQNEVDKDASEQSELFGALSDRIFDNRSQYSGDSAKPDCSSLNMEIRVSCPLELPPENGRTSHSIPESPCSNGFVDAGASDDSDSIHKSLPSTSGSEQEENYGPIDEHDQVQSDSGWNMEEEMEIVNTDYVSYGDNCFPGCSIVFSKSSIKLETSTLEEESCVFGSEWNLDEILNIESQWSNTTGTAKVKVCLFTRDALQEEIAHGMRGIEVLEFLIHDSLWLEKQDNIMSLDMRYRALWNIRLSGKLCEGGPYALENGESSSDPYLPNFEEPFEEVVFPKGAADAVVISKRDVDLLEPETFLNDTIIDFYIKYLENEISSSDRRRFHFFNCFFFRKLADPDNNPSGVFDGKAGFQRVRKWTRKVNIFEKDYIFIPVNYNLHWSLIVVCHPGGVANSNDENVDESVKVPCILHMDSIRGSHAGLKDLVQSYLSEEWKQKHKETSEDIVSKFLNLRFLSLELPQQENYSDCGLFLLHYAELFIAEVPDNFSPFQINKFSNFLRPDWFMPAEASLKRVHIQRLIYKLLEVCPPENASPCNHDSQPPALPENKENDSGLQFISERNPGKSLNSLHSQPIQGIEMSLLDMPPSCRTPECTNVSGMVMSELIEQYRQYDQGVSFARPRCPMPPIKEEAVDDDHHDASTFDQTELLQIDEMTSAACDNCYTPQDFSRGFPWNLGFSNLVDPEGNSPLPSNCSSDDSEEMMIIESEQEVEGAASGQNLNFDQAKETIDSMTESYASASSDMMETPAEDSQEFAELYGNDDLEDLHKPSEEKAKQSSNSDLEDLCTPNNEEAKEPSNSDLEDLHMPNPEMAKELSNGDLVESHTPNQEEAKEPSNNDPEESHTRNEDEAKEPLNNDPEESHTPNQVEVDESSQQEFEKIEDGGDSAGILEVVEDSSSDLEEERAAKRVRLSAPADGEREIVRMSKELEV